MAPAPWLSPFLGRQTASVFNSCALGPFLTPHWSSVGIVYTATGGAHGPGASVSHNGSSSSTCPQLASSHPRLSSPRPCLCFRDHLPDKLLITGSSCGATRPKTAGSHRLGVSFLVYETGNLMCAVTLEGHTHTTLGSWLRPSTFSHIHSGCNKSSCPLTGPGTAERFCCCQSSPIGKPIPQA